MELVIEPYSCIGSICLNKSRKDIRGLFYNNFTTFHRENLESESDHFLESTIEVEYENELSVLIAVDNQHQVKFREKKIFESTVGQLLDYLKSFEKNLYIDDVTILAIDAGISIYFEDEIEGYPRQIGIFSKGYYDEYLNLYEKVI